MENLRKTGEQIGTEGRTNEELADLIRNGDREAASQLCCQNEGFLMTRAKRLAPYCEMEDLKQEAAIALLHAVRSFDPAQGVKLLTYAAPIIDAALLHTAAQTSLPLSLPDGRYQQLRQVAYLCAGGEQTEEELCAAVQEKLEVSYMVACRLLREYRRLFLPAPKDSREDGTAAYEDPAKVYDRQHRRELLLQRAEEVLTRREWTLIRFHLGLNQPDEQQMTFRDLAARLNYNDASGAEKAYKKAIRKLRDGLDGGGYGCWIRAQRFMREAIRQG